jgi:hypothetical protein
MRNAVAIGSKLRKADAPGYVLEIMELSTLEGELPHARARVSIATHDLGMRLYSISALEDSRHFVPVVDTSSQD